VRRAKLTGMTTREKLIRDVLDLPESEIEPVVEFIASRGANGTDGTVDEWGDLDGFGTALMGDALRRLDEEERAELGETIAEAWQRESST
jgi:hypothetical protein